MIGVRHFGYEYAGSAGNKRLSGFGFVFGCLLSMWLCTSSIKLVDFALSCWRAEGTEQQYVEPGISFTRVPARLR